MAKRRVSVKNDRAIPGDDDCAICRAMHDANKKGKKLSYEELHKAFQQARKESGEGVFVFETRLQEQEKEVSRTIAVPDTWSLYQLAEAIIAAYSFNLDHCFGFFDADAENPFSAVRKYELLTDLIEEGDDLEPTGAGSVKKTRLNQVWAKHGDSMLFLFDYGDGWQFSVTLVTAGSRAPYPLPALLQSVGKAPRQYDGL